MELIVITPNKLKIMLSDDEMIKYELNRLDTDSYSADIRIAFRSMMKEIKLQSGFDAEGERVYVQLYPCRGGGCEMYVTKLGKDSFDVAPDDTITSSDLATTDFDRLRGEIYGFSELSDLLSACRALEQRFAEKHTTAYLGDSGKYLLIFERALSDPEKQLLDEFGERQRCEVINVYIHEHWKKLCEGNAVEILSHC